MQTEESEADYGLIIGQLRVWVGYGWLCDRVEKLHNGESLERVQKAY